MCTSESESLYTCMTDVQSESESLCTFRTDVYAQLYVSPERSGTPLASEENDLVCPSKDFSNQALIPSPQKYLEMYKRSIEDPSETLAQRILDCKPKSVITCNAVKRGPKVLNLKEIVDVGLTECAKNGISVDVCLTYENQLATNRESTKWQEGRDIWWQRNYS
ncbi:hypothetical protein LWI29_002347 [Acer saccharum]|uniref:Uncharacterized protein n=1 Tax=Acer saccharum TaxID=4024 RepID=A0AA39RTV1_ACESA|nr:hypothetical protein LWI29_002347 [Acer saccharum]